MVAKIWNGRRTLFYEVNKFLYKHNLGDVYFSTCTGRVDSVFIETHYCGERLKRCVLQEVVNLTAESTSSTYRYVPPQIDNCVK